MQSVLTTATQFSVWLSQSVRPHLSQIAVAMSMTLLAIFGNDINNRVKRYASKWPWVVRLAVFILLVAFGYGVLSLLIAHVFTGLLRQVDNRFLAATVALCFVLI